MGGQTCHDLASRHPFFSPFLSLFILRVVLLFSRQILLHAQAREFLSAPYGLVH